MQNPLKQIVVHNYYICDFVYHSDLLHFLQFCYFDNMNIFLSFFFEIESTKKIINSITFEIRRIYIKITTTQNSYADVNLSRMGDEIIKTGLW